MLHLLPPIGFGIAPSPIACFPAVSIGQWLHDMADVKCVSNCQFHNSGNDITLCQPSTTMKFQLGLLLLLVSAFPASGLVTPTTSLAKSSTPNVSTKLHAETAAAEIPRGGQGGGTASIPSEVFNLIKSIVGAGVLSLPAGKSGKGTLGIFGYPW